MTKRKVTQRRRDPNVYPPGWDYQRARAVADYYEARKDQVVLRRCYRRRRDQCFVWMEVPPELVPEVRKLIARRREINN